MAKTELLDILQKAKGKRILVIGDIMLDKYIWGEVSRISPEAPVQIVEAKRDTYAAGGTANVAANIASLGGNVSLISMVGRDEARDKLLSLLKEHGIDAENVITDADKPTTIKIRVMGRSQQLIRVDYESREHVHPEMEKTFINAVKGSGKDYDAIVISDYAKGVITPRLMDTVKETCKKNGIPLIVDPKPCHKDLYKGATVITPNHQEACEIAGREVENNKAIEMLGQDLSRELEADIILTRGEKGMTVISKGKDPLTIPTLAKEVFDVTGAGDTVVAAVAISLAADASLHNAAILANHAAGIKVGKIGTSAITTAELEKSIRESHDD